MSALLAPFAATAVLIDLPNKFQDAYALWALQTDFRAFKRGGEIKPSELTFLLELEKPFSPTFPFAGITDTAVGAFVIKIEDVELRLPRAYARPLPRTCLTVHFITLRLSVKDLPSDLLRLVVKALMNGPGIKRLQIGFQRPSYDFPVVPDVGASGGGVSKLLSVSVPRVVLGVIEDACPFGHAATLNAGATRIVSLWDQSTVSMPITSPWMPPPSFPYGKRLSQYAMTALLAQFTTDGSVDEEALYADPRVAMLGLLERASHGAAVIGLLAGKTALLGNGLPDDGVPAALTAAQIQVDADLQDAPVVVVRLPCEQTTISSGRWLAINVIDALHCIMGEAADLVAPLSPPPLVVNVSYGAIAGPHDGTTMVEMAVDELCDGYKNMAVVVAAGNAHGTVHNTDALDPTQVLASGVHAVHTLLPGQSATLTLQVPADKSFETYLELWFSDQDSGPDADQWLTPDDVEITVVSPDGTVSLVARCGSQCYEPANGVQTVAGLVFVKKASQSLHRSMALLVLAATRVHASYVEAPAGRWTITLVSLRQPGDADARSLSVQAWVERDDTTFGIDRPQSARLVPNDDGAAAHLNDQNIFSTLAGGQCSWSVGALVPPVQLPGPWRASSYTAAGPDDNHGPTVSAVADAGIALSGIRVAGSRSGMVVRSNGTSMAAPQAARWIAQGLARGFSLQQIYDWLPTAGRDARRGPKVPF